MELVSENVELKRGTWSPEEDKKLIDYINRYRIWNWSLMPKAAGIRRSGKSCRLRWMNYLRPELKRGDFSLDEVELIIKLHASLGNKWSQIAKQLPGRTDNDIKNLWNTHLKKCIKSCSSLLVRNYKAKKLTGKVKRPYTPPHQATSTTVPQSHPQIPNSFPVIVESFPLIVNEADRDNQMALDDIMGSFVHQELDTMMNMMSQEPEPSNSSPAGEYSSSFGSSFIGESSPNFDIPYSQRDPSVACSSGCTYQGESSPPLEYSFQGDSSTSSFWSTLEAELLSGLRIHDPEFNAHQELLWDSFGSMEAADDERTSEGSLFRGI